MKRIFSFTLTLSVESPVSFQSFSGFASSGLFYNIVASADAVFAEELHQSKKIAPWAATPITPTLNPRNVIYKKLEADSAFNVTFTVMDERLAEKFRDALFNPNLKLHLSTVEARLLNISIKTHSFSEIASKAEPLPSKFALEFITPTVFRRPVYECCPTCPLYKKHLDSNQKGEGKPCKHATPRGGQLVPLPLPSLMFKNLARIWSSFSDTPIDAWEAAKWSEDAILVAGFPKGLRTVRLYEHTTTNKWIVGFTGTVRFAIEREKYNKELAKTAHALLKMAELTNVGVRRTAGLGMVRYIPPEDTAEEDGTA